MWYCSECFSIFDVPYEYCPYCGSYNIEEKYLDECEEEYER